MRSNELGVMIMMVVATGAPTPAGAQAASFTYTPLEVPTSTATETDFAPQLYKTCNALHAKGIARMDGAFVISSTGAPALGSPAMRGLAASCGRLRDASPLTDGDVTNFRVVFGADAAALARHVEGQAARLSGPLTATPLGAASPVLENLIAGVSQFIYDRAKAEALAYLSRTLAELVCAPRTRPYFSQVCGVLGDATPTLPLSSTATYLANAAKRDLAQLPDVMMVGALASPATQEAQRPLLRAGRRAFAFARATAGGRDPLDVARSLHLLQTTTVADDRITGPDAVLVLASALVDAVTQQQGWRQVGADALLRRCYALGTYFSLERISAEKEVPLPLPPATALSAVASALEQVLDDLRALAAELDAAAQAVAAAAAEQTRAPRGDFEVRAAPAAPTPAPSSSPTRAYARVATRVLEVGSRHGANIALTLRLARPQDLAWVSKLHVILALARALVDEASPSEIALAATEALRVLVPADRSELTDRLQRAIPFVVQLAEARTPDQVQALLEAAAVPPGSYALKYQKTMLTVNALVGVAGGPEWTFVGATQLGGTVGAFAPLGLHFTTPMGQSGGHFGALLSVMNVGALVSARFAEDARLVSEDGTETTISTTPDIDPANLFAPGLFVTFGIAESPFLVGGGAQVLPARTTEEKTTSAVDGTAEVEASSTPALQLLLFLAIDVPIFAL